MRRLAALVSLVCLAAPAWAAEGFFAIRVVDEETGRGVPLVELETTNAVKYVTDSSGYVALGEPALFGQRVFFTVRSHGYEFAKDGFGYPGKALEVTDGGEATLKIKRINIAERLYRVTGADIYRDSVLLGKPVPIEKPLLNGEVVGSDSVLTAVYGGKVRWFWGDTLRPAYPLGLFHVPGAVSELPGKGGLDPNDGVNLTYFEGQDGFARATMEMSGEGPTWGGGLSVFKDSSGKERMFAGYMKVKPPLSIYARGIAEWDEDAKRFKKVADVPLDAPARPDGHPFLHVDDGVEYVYFATPFPMTRVRATPESFVDVSQYETYTCLMEGSRLDEKDVSKAKLDRGADGKLHYSWKRNTPALDAGGQKKLIDAGLMKLEESPFALRDRDSGKPFLAHGGSVYWNEFRSRWVMIVLEGFGGPSFLGECWCAEADRPEGPWTYAVKVVTHDKQDFYNPKQHPMFDADGGRTIFFEGTYTNSFSGNPHKTPRYEYNQMMYKLDLGDERVALPVAFHRAPAGDGRLFAEAVSGESWGRDAEFFALDRAVEGTVPVYRSAGVGGLGLTLDTSVASDGRPLFHAHRADGTTPGATLTPLYEFVDTETGRRDYGVDVEAPAGFERAAKPVCLVWINPLRSTPRPVGP